MSVPGMAAEVFLGEYGQGTPNMNIANTPPATGSIVPPQSPSGAITTNTGRTLSATQTYYNTMRILK